MQTKIVFKIKEQMLNVKKSDFFFFLNCPKNEIIKFRMSSKLQKIENIQKMMKKN